MICKQFGGRQLSPYYGWCSFADAKCWHDDVSLSINNHGFRTSASAARPAESDLGVYSMACSLLTGKFARTPTFSPISA